MSAGTLTLTTAEIYRRSQNPEILSPLPPFPADFPVSKLIPKTRFVIDGFRNAGDFSLSYFLSHFHSDHYSGLTATWTNGVVFCSDITAKLVVDILGVSPEYVVKLPTNVTVIIDGVEVTLIDANHCPGAVQFLFSVEFGGKFEKFVHTGDFRFCNDMKLLPALRCFVGCDAVFLDTTYCNPKFVFPLQEESIDYAVSVIDRISSENCDDNDRRRVLFLVATYVVGKERILVEISRRCGRKICVDSRKMKVLKALGYVDEGVFTEDEGATDVHVVGWNVLGETWPYFRPNFVKMKEIMAEKGYGRVVGFVPTGWTYEVKRNKFAIRTKDELEIHLVPYSEHSNYNELREYVKFLKPKRVVPTVGSDVESVDSKHAAKMQKHFAGLVDEMANKQEFLMGFYRVSKEKGECGLSDSGSGAGKAVELLEEDSNAGKVEDDPKICAESTVKEQNLAVLSDNDKKEIMQELCDCLPVWVSEDQKLELISIYGRNIVDAVSHFYEHETEYHEKSGSSFSSSQPNSGVDCETVGSPSSVKCSLPDVKSPIKALKFPLSKKLVGSSVSPGKRKRGSEKKTKSKGKVTSNVEPSGIKQSTITKFFSKHQRVDQGGSTAASLPEKCSSDKNITDANSSEPYTEETDQFIQIINGDSSVRGFAAELLLKSRGNLDLALDIYYSRSKVDLAGHEDAINKSVTVEDPDVSRSNQEKERCKASNVVLHSAKESLEKNAVINYITLPPEEYSPIEHACWKQGQPAPYMHLSRTFDLVEAEKGKIKAASMLCNMFRSLLALSPDDVLPAVYLCTNKIAADHENVELNIGGSLVTSAIEEACGTNRGKLKDLYNTLGDLGDVAQECRQTQTLLLPPPPLLIRDVYSVLRKISVQTGSGSTKRRKSLIVGLMRSCREKEMKFLVRTLVRNLRIGAMMRTVLPALAQAVALNYLSSSVKGAIKNPKELLQRLSAAVVDAYNVLPDLDVLVPSIMSKGIEFSTTTLTMVPGIPIKPMLAKITNGVVQALEQFQNRAFTCEYKYDGQRAQIHKLDDGSVRIFSRNGDETTKRFPDVVHIIQESCKPSAVSFILDTEVVGIDRKNGHKFLSFQELSARERGSKVSLVTVDKIKVDICIIVFDVMFVNGEKLLDYPLRKRRRCINELFKGENPGFFQYAQEITVEAEDARPDCEATVARINSFLEDSFQSSCEGIMVKSLDVDAAYLASKRSDSWAKVKRDYLDGVGDSLDLVPIGAWCGNGRKAGWYSPFLMACYNPDTEEFESVCRAMSGFSDSFYTEMKEFFSGDKILYKKPLYYRTDEAPDMWFSAEIVWEIRGADLTVSPVHKAAVGIVHPSRGISMRFPRFIRSVSDRRPEDCSTSTDVADMFHSQTRKMDVTGAR
ncbi:hypothetical protein vseg_006547 [Gypsophila vaccaria]